MDSGSEPEVLQVTRHGRVRPTRRRAVVVDVEAVNASAKTRKARKSSKRNVPNKRNSEAKRRRLAPKLPGPEPVDLEDDDHVIETCTSYEEAFLGYIPKTVFDAGELHGPHLPPPVSRSPSPTTCPDPVINTANTGSASSSSSAARSAELPVQTTSLSLLALSISCRQRRRQPPPPLKLVTLPRELMLPEAPIAPESCESQMPLPDEQAERIIFDEEPEEVVPQVPYSQAYVERLRSSCAGLEEKCCVCVAPFMAGDLRFGYAHVVAGKPLQSKWLHLRCLPEENLQMEPGEWVALSPGVTSDERQRLMAILSIRRSGHPKRPQLWYYAPAIRQSWERWTVPRNGSSRPVPTTPRYTAPLLSLVSQQARAVLLRARQRRWQQVHAPTSRRAMGSGPSVVARRAQVTATSRRPAQAADTRSENTRGQRQWRRQNALGERAQEFFAAAPVIILERDWSTEEPCIICHETLMKGDEVRRLPCCHTFHRSCIDRWLRLKAVCPLDKLSVQELLSQPRENLDVQPPSAEARP